MDELITCSINCSNKPIYLCDCSDNKSVFLCQSHLGEHGETPGSHHFTPIMKNPDPQTRKIISEFLKGLKQKIKQDRLTLLQEASILVMQIEEKVEKSLEKILFIEKRLNEYIYLCATLDKINQFNSSSFIESLLNLSPEKAAKIKYQEDIVKINNVQLKKGIKKFFNILDSLLYEESFYFITNDYRLIQFDLKNKQLKHLKTLAESTLSSVWRSSSKFTNKIIN
ncbi:unnamed protein product [Blepharisma stoltei]|uniref:Uncharacterized protein n=1 Tax=Blepharisma stoltei TaxID=1481888 RepID=A0AAU9J132_9CILI|nr:unnamed protein product [Blepharisma stoltei]